MKMHIGDAHIYTYKVSNKKRTWISNHALLKKIKSSSIMFSKVKNKPKQNPNCIIYKIFEPAAINKRI